MFQRGSSPIQLSQLNLQPAIDASAKLADSQAFLADSVNKSILNFVNKQEEKKQEAMSIGSLQEMFDLDETTAKAVYKDPIVRDAFTMQKKAEYEAARATASAKEIEASQLRALYPNMPEAIVLDIVNDRLIPEETADNQPTGNFISKSSGQLINLGLYTGQTQPEIEPQPQPEPEPGPDSDGFEAPTLANQGLYGRLILLDERKDSPTGLEQAVVGGIDNLFTSVFGDSPVNLDPEIRSFQNDLENNLNIFANALKVGTKYSSTEQRDMVQAMEEMSSGLSTGAFKSAEQLKSAMVSLDKRFDSEIMRLEKLLDARRLNATSKSNYRGMLSQVRNAKKLLGVDLYNQSKLSGLDIDAELDELDNLPF